MTWIQLEVYINLAEVNICLSYQNCYKICSDKQIRFSGKEEIDGYLNEISGK